MRAPSLSLLHTQQVGHSSTVRVPFDFFEWTYTYPHLLADHLHAPQCDLGGLGQGDQSILPAPPHTLSHCYMSQSGGLPRPSVNQSSKQAIAIPSIRTTKSALPNNQTGVALLKATIQKPTFATYLHKRRHPVLRDVALVALPCVVEGVAHHLRNDAGRAEADGC